jgi:hypothetical protein
MRTDPVPGWETTDLWKGLTGRKGEPAVSLRRTMESVLPKVEAVLTDGDSSPGTFTLHSAHHSWNVAQHMARLAGKKLLSEMEPYDLGLLLLSAYLHDIGMTPPVSRLEGLKAYLLSGDEAGLPQEEREALQAWLDDHADGITPPMSEGPPTLEVLQRARSLLAQYVRSRHNDWSAAWMTEHLAKIDEDTYDGFLADLILLCTSHHFGYDRLRMDEFAPRLVGSPSSVLHLRFDACLLRVADVLDFDPERTPKILYTHRDVEDTSAIFWHKDHKLAFAQKKDRLRIHARPTDALTHHAIDLTIQDVDRELQLCRRLSEETPFDRMGDEELPHRWVMETNVRADVKPRNNAYEYIDGTFKPDQERILELLGGVALYGSPMAAVRELLQNAFDAVREQIAYQRLRQEHPASDSTREQIASMHRITLVLEENDEGVRLTCRDTGVGMSREVIKSRFLVGGSSPSHETRSLERICKAKGFSVGRTARFGIGVLAYFLIGSRLCLRTRRSIEAGDDEGGSGWTFVSEGLTDFGELRRNGDCPLGTEIELQIRRDVMRGGTQKFAEKLDEYVRTTVRRVPCHFTFVARGSGLEPFTCEPGWIDHGQDAEEAMLSSMSAHERKLPVADVDLLSSEMRRDFERNRERWRKVQAHAAQRLKMTLEEGDMPDNLGSYRISQGHFQICDQPLLVYLDLVESDSETQVRPIEGGLAVAMGSDVVLSWNGMRIDGNAAHPAYGPEADLRQSGIYFEIDWTDNSAGELAVDRGHVALSNKAESALSFVRGRALSLQEQFVREHEDSPLALLNAHVAETTIDVVDSSLWPQIPENDSEAPVALAPMSFPAVDHGSLRPVLSFVPVSDEPVDDNRQLRWRGQPISTLRAMQLASGGSWTWHGLLFAPQFLGVQAGQNDTTRPIPIWTGYRACESAHGEFVVEFPPAWKHLACVNIAMDSEPKHWNAAHPLVQAVDAAGLKWVEERLDSSRDPVPHEEELLQSPGRVGAWIMLCIEEEERALWAGLQERAPSLLPKAWELLGLGEGDEILEWEEGYFERSLRSLSPHSWEEDVADQGIVEAVGDPGGEWWLTTAPADSEAS